MRAAGFLCIVLVGTLIGAAPLAAGGCPCPKAKMVELYGSVSMFPPKMPGSRVHRQPRASKEPPVPVTALPSMAEITGSVPVSALDPMAAPRGWEPLFVQQ
ncbi:MAG: hypothetical protein IPK59_14470 [Rhodospirillaceae bacterium]|nr:hypothetical protein [Rhodospirillaceae bacterium]